MYSARYFFIFTIIYKSIKPHSIHAKCYSIFTVLLFSVKQIIFLDVMVKGPCQKKIMH